LIIQLTTDEYPADEFAIGLDRVPTVDELASRAKVRKGSYAYELMGSIHWALRRSLNLKADYDTYFAVEYPTFAEYLVRRYRYQNDALKALGKLYKKFPVVLLYDPEITILGGTEAPKLLAKLLKE
jgi:hypothetical protein